MKASIKQNSRVGGRYTVSVRNADGSLARQLPAQGNLLLPGGLDPSKNWNGNIVECHAGSGTTPNKELLDGTFSQSGTTVVRDTGSGVFASGNVGDFIKFAGGEYAKIVSFTNTLTVEVDRTQTVAASALTVYNTSRTALETEVKTTTTTDVAAGSQGFAADTDLGTMNYWKTFNFSTETGAVVYSELGISPGGVFDLLSRIVLDASVAVDDGQFLQVRFDITATLGNYRTLAAIDVDITGWPRPYNVESIVANGTTFDVTFDENHHYIVGGEITITGALPPLTPITSISSDVSEFTVTTDSAHGFSVSDSVVIDGASQAGYDGTWTVAAVDSATVFRVTSGANPGASTGGTVRDATPGTWFDGTWTIASVPTSDSIRITSAINPIDAGASGTVESNLNAQAIVTGHAFYNGNSNSVLHGPLDFSQGVIARVLRIYPNATKATGMVYGASQNATGGLQTGLVAEAYSTANRSKKFVGTFGSGEGLMNSIKQIGFQALSGEIIVELDEIQRKDNGFSLAIEYTISWEPDLD